MKPDAQPDSLRRSGGGVQGGATQHPKALR
jgi:hypothetical protein